MRMTQTLEEKVDPVDKTQLLEIATTDVANRLTREQNIRMVRTEYLGQCIEATYHPHHSFCRMRVSEDRGEDIYLELERSEGSEPIAALQRTDALRGAHIVRVIYDRNGRYRICKTRVYDESLNPVPGTEDTAHYARGYGRMAPLDVKKKIYGPRKADAYRITPLYREMMAIKRTLERHSRDPHRALPEHSETCEGMQR